MTEEEKKAIDEFKSRREYFEYQPEGCNWQLSFDQWEVESIIDIILNLIQKQDTEINKLNNVIDKYRQEREYIKNNLEVDLQRKGVLAQAKGQIAQILEYYKNNDEYFMKE